MLGVGLGQGILSDLSGIITGAPEMLEVCRMVDRVGASIGLVPIVGARLEAYRQSLYHALDLIKGLALTQKKPAAAAP